jgi:ATP-dependent Clp protease ATP-binding subunit ClpX
MVAIASRLPSAPEITQSLDHHVIGQRRAKKKLARAIYAHYLGNRYRRCLHSQGVGFGLQHLLLAGPSGVGKTFLIKRAAALIGVPTLFVPATSLVETGYVGQSIDSLGPMLLAAAGGDPRLAEHAIVILDEFDKLKRARDVSRDVSGEGVQNGLLTLFDGRPLAARTRDGEVSLDTSRLLIVATGAFDGLTGVIRDRLMRAERAGCGLGFAGASSSHRVASETELLAQLMPDDLIRYGFLPELIARFCHIVTLDPLTRSELCRVLEETPHSPWREKQRLFEMHGVRLMLDDEGRDALVDKALARGLGARTLRSVVSDCLGDAEFELDVLRQHGIGAVRFTRAAVEGRERPEWIRREDMTDPVEPEVSAADLRADPFGGQERPQQEELKRKIKFRLAADGVTFEPERRKEPRGDQDPPSLFDGPEKN